MATSVYDRRGLDLVGEMRLQWSGAREGVGAAYGGGGRRPRRTTAASAAIDPDA